MVEKSLQAKEVKTPKKMPASVQSPKSAKRCFTLTDFIIPIKGEEDEPKVMQCNHISRLRNPRAVFPPIKKNDENPSEDVHHRYYIVGTSSEEEEDEYLSDEVLFEGDFNDEQSEEEDVTPFNVDMDNEEARLYPKNFSPIHVSIYNPHKIPEGDWQNLEQFPLPPKIHPDLLLVVSELPPNPSLDVVTTAQAEEQSDPVMEQPEVHSKLPINTTTPRKIGGIKKDTTSKPPNQAEDAIDDSPIEGLGDLQISIAPSVVPCHVASDTSGPESSDVVTIARGNVVARFSDKTSIVEKEIAELWINELFNPHPNEVCEIGRGTRLGKTISESTANLNLF